MKVFKSAVLLAAMGGSSAMAQVQSSTPLNIRLNPFAFVLNTLAGGVEIGLHENFGLGLSGSYLYSVDHLNKDYEGSSYGAGLSAAYYASSMRSDSLYLKGELDYARAGVTRRSDKKSDTLGVYSGEVLVGYQWVWDSGFNVGLGVGAAQTKFSNLKTFNKDFKKDLELVHPTGELKFGMMI